MAALKISFFMNSLLLRARGPCFHPNATNGAR